MRDVRTTTTGPAGFGGALADGEVQVLDLVGDALFEREGNDLRQLGGILGRRIALGDQHVAGRDDDRDAAPTDSGTACSSSPDTALTSTWPSSLHTIQAGRAPSRN
jgi:hypothetical protein